MDPYFYRTLFLKLSLVPPPPSGETNMSMLQAVIYFILCRNSDTFFQEHVSMHLWLQLPFILNRDLLFDWHEFCFSELSCYNHCNHLYRTNNLTSSFLSNDDDDHKPFEIMKDQISFRCFSYHGRKVRLFS